MIYLLDKHLHEETKLLLNSYLSKYPAGFADIYACRYLFKRDEFLWDKVLILTNFLTGNIMPKQRVWHILNNFYEIPICPVSGNPVAWSSGKYEKHYSRAEIYKDPATYNLRIKTYKEKTGYDHWWDNSNVINQAQNTRKINKAAGKHKIYRTLTVEEIFIRTEKTKQTNMEKYGVENTFQAPEIIKQIKDIQYIKFHGMTYDEFVDRNGIYLRDIYYNIVGEYTGYNWRNYSERINSEGHIRSTEWHLDHIYSINAGLNNNVPPEIIGHWTNLRIIHHAINESKCNKCDKTIDQLYSDYIREEKIEACMLSDKPV